MATPVEFLYTLEVWYMGALGTFKEAIHGRHTDWLEPGRHAARLGMEGFKVPHPGHSTTATAFLYVPPARIIRITFDGVYDVAGAAAGR